MASKKKATKKKVTKKKATKKKPSKKDIAKAIKAAKAEYEKSYKDEPVSGLRAERLLSYSKMKLLGRFPFWGRVAAHMPFIENDRIPTTAVDRSGRVYYNRKWVNHFTKEDALFELAHEVGHVVQRSFDRCPPNAIHWLWNKAADWVVDTFLKEAGLPQSSISKKMVGDEESAKVEELGFLTEKVYHHLLETAKDEALETGCKACQQMLGMVDDAAQETDEEQKKENEQANGEGEEEGDGAPGGNSESPGGEDGEGDGEGEGDGSGEGDGGCGTGSGSPSDLEQHTCGNIRACCAGSTGKFDDKSDPMDQQKWAQVLINAKEHADAQGKGDVPGVLGDSIRGLTQSTVRWQEWLKSTSTKIFGRDRYSYKRYNRRGLAMKIRLPKAVPDGKSAIMFADTSGSMSREAVVQCFSEAAEIMKQCGCKKLYFGLHDYSVYYIGETDEAALKRLKISEGGTSHRDVFRILNGESVKLTDGTEFQLPKTETVELAILFTDLGTDFPDERPKYDVIWGVPTDGYPGMSCDVPFGQKVAIDMKAMTGEK
jgi:predicted metal-dependent peptidase